MLTKYGSVIYSDARVIIVKWNQVMVVIMCFNHKVGKTWSGESHSESCLFWQVKRLSSDCFFFFLNYIFFIWFVFFFLSSFLFFSFFLFLFLFRFLFFCFFVFLFFCFFVFCFFFFWLLFLRGHWKRSFHRELKEIGFGEIVGESIYHDQCSLDEEYLIHSHLEAKYEGSQRCNSHLFSFFE